MRQFLVAGVALLVIQGALGYGAVRRRPKQPYQPPPSPPQDKNILSTQYYPSSHNCSSLQNVPSTEVHQVHHTQRQLPHAHVTHHVTPIVRTHVHHQPPVEVLRTTKTVYQPPDIVHRTVDYEHHDHVTQYPGSTRTHTHTNYYPGQGRRTHTQSIDDKIPSNRKATEIHHDEVQHEQHHQRHHSPPSQQHDSHAHFGRVPTGNAVVTSYFNFPGSGRSDNAFKAPAPNRKVDYQPVRHHSPAYSPLQAQSIEDDSDDDDVPVRKPAPAASPKPRPPIYERISPSASARAVQVPYYRDEASDSKRPTVFPPPSSTRPLDEVHPQRYPTTSFASPNRRRPEPLQLKEKESDSTEDSRDEKPEINDENEAPKNKNPAFLKLAPASKPFQPEFPQKSVQDFDTRANQRLSNSNRQHQPSPNRITQDIDKPTKDFTRPSPDTFNQRPSSESFNPRPSPDTFNRRPSPESFNRRPSPESFNRRPSPESFNRRPSPESFNRRPSPESFNRRPSPESFNREQSRTEPNNPDQDLKSASQEHPDYAYPLRYSLEQVPTASLRYHDS